MVFENKGNPQDQMQFLKDLNHCLNDYFVMEYLSENNHKVLLEFILKACISQSYNHSEDISYNSVTNLLHLTLDSLLKVKNQNLI